jgi:HK97 family phage prohead protease
MKIERRMLLIPAVCEARADGVAPKIAGRAAVFYDGSRETQYELYPGMFERIMPGAFDRALAEDDVLGLFNHDMNLVLGRVKAGTMRLSVDAAGLNYDIDPADTTVARDVREHIRRKDVAGSSFTFAVTDQDFILESGYRVRRVKGVRLMDVGPVSNAAYKATTASSRHADVSPEEVAQIMEQAKAAEASIHSRMEYFRQRLRLASVT